MVDAPTGHHHSPQIALDSVVVKPTQDGPVGVGPQRLPRLGRLSSFLPQLDSLLKHTEEGWSHQEISARKNVRFWDAFDNLHPHSIRNGTPWFAIKLSSAGAY